MCAKGTEACMIAQFPWRNIHPLDTIVRPHYLLHFFCGLSPGRIPNFCAWRLTGSCTEMDMQVPQISVQWNAGDPALFSN
jgi:hypothetical protein